MAVSTSAQLAQTGTLTDFIEDLAAKYDSRPALLMKLGFRYQRWSYARLWEQSGRVASLLQQMGLARGDRVLIWGPNSPQWVLAFFGCVRAGVIAVPLDMRSAEDFVRTVAAKTDPKAAFISRVTPRGDIEFGVPELSLDDLEVLCIDQPPPEPVEFDETDLVEIMFTSGTTGDPKGVMLTHRNLASNVVSASQFVSGKPSDRLLSILPLSHMFEQMGGLLLPLQAGANITYATSYQPSVLFKTMKERKVTLMLLVPQILDLFMKGIEREVSRQGKEGFWRLAMTVAARVPMPVRRRIFRKVHGQLGGALDLIIAGGAPLSPELGAKWEALGVTVLQGYGATEASPGITFHTLENPRYDSGGRPLPGVDVKIADDGEVLVRGPNITPGYWEAPDRTAEAFVDGWYRTGDQGSFDEDGYLHLSGRKKDMIVLSSGQNVYPEDVEATLNKHAEVVDAVVVGLPRESDVEVHAVLILEDPLQAQQIVARVNDQLASHQRIRGHTVWAGEDFPRTHTMKVKKGLVLDSITQNDAETETAPASSAQPRQTSARGVTALIVEVTGLPPAQVAPDRSLESLDLDSLGRVALLSAIEAELGVYVDEALVGPHTTVRNIEDMVASSSANGAMPRFPSWGMSLWCRLVRGALQRTMVFPIVFSAYRLKVTGAENLSAVEGPVLFAANHTLHLDNGIILRAMPFSSRRRLAIAASDHMFANRIQGLSIPLLGNGFPFSKEGNVRASLENLGRILDNGWSVLIYPEGELTVGGPMKPFLSGTGLLAVGGQVSVIPVHLRIDRFGKPSYLPLLRRGRVEVRFGEPITFAPGTAYDEATRTVETAVAAL
ncbi:MAG TPA: hypothetical protein DCP37_01740 [Dehalococcoidia bacterium]|nr:hypothetical protein [Dehalococcoidia bacterium]